MTDELLISEDGSVAFSAGHSIAYSMERSTAPAATPTTGTVLTPLTTNIGQVAYWGNDNAFPNLIQSILANDAEMTKLIDWVVRASMGKGIVLRQVVDWDDQGEEITQPIKDRELIEFFTGDMVNNYIHKSFIDLHTYFNVFPEMIPTRDRSRIALISPNWAMHCRWAQMGPDGKLKEVIHNKNWGIAGMVNLTDGVQTTRIPAIDPLDYDLVNKVRGDKSLVKFVFPVNYPTIGRTYYQVAHWDGLRVSGWLDVAAKIPAFKSALLKNQMTIKYLVRIPNTYWPAVFKNWDNMDDTQRRLVKKAKLQEIDRSLTDVTNAGKTILNEVGFDPVTKEKLPGWEIEVIDDKTKQGAFLEDSQEASAHKMRALGLDNSLVGALETGKKMGGGSGSDKLQAWNIFTALINPYRNVVLAPLKFIAKYNGWSEKYPGLTIKFRDTILQTQNINQQVVKEVEQ